MRGSCLLAILRRDLPQAFAGQVVDGNVFFEGLVITAQMLGQGIGHYFVHVDADALQFLLRDLLDLIIVWQPLIGLIATRKCRPGANRYAPACRGLRIARPCVGCGSGWGVLGAGAIAGSQ